MGIGIVSYRGGTVTLTGAFVGNVARVVYAGYNSSPSTTISGVPLELVDILTRPDATLSDSQGNPSIICAYSAGALLPGSRFGGCNSYPQVHHFMLSRLGGQIIGNQCQYGAFSGTLLTSVPGSCTCSPLTCSQLLADCGSASDGCGGTLSCGACSGEEQCGASGIPNQCGGCPAGQLLAGPRVPAVVTDDPSTGTRTWSSPFSAAASDDSYAYVSAMVSVEVSSYLKATDFGFSVPSGATIRGISVTWERTSLSGVGITDEAVRGVQGGVVGSVDRSSGVRWAKGIEVSMSYGGPADLWGLSVTADDINDPGFGAALSVIYDSVSGNDHARVDSVRMFACYE